jgi:DNA-binding transcriptional LysR family regulator
VDTDWDDLRLFLLAAEQGTFTAAARVAGLEQSTLSRRMAALETRLGGALFLRARSGLTLTEQGERVLPLAREARARMQEVAEAVRPAVAGRVRVALTEGMVAALPALLDAHPELEVELVTGDTLSDLSRREADLALRFVRPERGDLVWRRAGALSQGLWGAHRWAQVPAEALAWILYEPGGFATPEAQWVRAHAARPARLITNGYLSMLAALRAGLGVGVIANVASKFQRPIPSHNRCIWWATPPAETHPAWPPCGIFSAPGPRCFRSGLAAVQRNRVAR